MLIQNLHIRFFWIVMLWKWWYSPKIHETDNFLNYNYGELCRNDPKEEYEYAERIFEDIIAWFYDSDDSINKLVHGANIEGNKEEHLWW